MTTKQKHEISFYLKGILKNIKPNFNQKYSTSQPLFIFHEKKEENNLVKLIADIEKEIYEEIYNFKEASCDNKTK